MPAIVPAIGLGSSIAGGLINRRKGSGGSSTSQSTSTRNDLFNFDPAALEAYQGLQPQAAAALGDFMSNPWQSGFFQQALTRSGEETGRRADAARRNFMNPALVGGVSGGGVQTGSLANPSGFFAAMMGDVERGASRERADSLVNLLLGSADLRQRASQQAMSYRPLQTGASSTGTSRSSGTTNTNTGGSLLGDLLGVGGNILLGGMGGGNSGGSSLPAPRPLTYDYPDWSYQI